MSFEGARFDELMHRIGATLLDGGDPPPFFVLVQGLDVPRFFPLYLEGEAGVLSLFVQAPENTYWKIHDARLFLVTDANVADRTFIIYKQFYDEMGATWRTVCEYISATVPASTTYDVELHKAASADPPAAIDSLLDVPFIALSGGNAQGKYRERLWLRCTNFEAGDKMYAQLSVEERTNYML